MRIRFIIPGDIDTPTGGYRYDRAIIAEWRREGVDVDLVSLPGSYPDPTDKAQETALAIIAGCAPADIAVIDGLAGGCSPALMHRLAQELPVVALVHHPLGLESGLDEEAGKRLLALEAEGLAAARLIITTSPATRAAVHQIFQRPLGEIHAILPGVERRAGSAREETRRFRTRRPLRILSVGSISERKGHDLMIAALGAVHARDPLLSWHLDLLGAPEFNPPLFERLKAMAKEHGIAGQITFHGAVDEKALERFYDDADVFALASRFEGYGMVYAEAIVRGLPVIATRAGAIPDTVPEVAGLLVPPDDVPALAEALFAMFSDDALRQSKQAGAIASAPDFPGWGSSARDFLSILEAI